MTTIVYPYLQRLSQGEELKYSIRSVCKYAQFEFDILIVGDKPTWYTGKYLPTHPIRGKRFTRAFDIARKLEIICDSKLITDDFLYMYDDQYFINPVQLADLSGAIAISEIVKREEARVGSEVWKELLKRTVDALHESGCERIYNYETHLPRVLNKARLKLVLDAYQLHKNPLLFNTIYFNEYFHQPRIILEQKNEIKAGVYNALISDQIRNQCRGKLVLNHGEKAYNHQMKIFLKNSFPENCKFESK